MNVPVVLMKLRLSIVSPVISSMTTHYVCGG
jgi:hypothetical protein